MFIIEFTGKHVKDKEGAYHRNCMEYCTNYSNKKDAKEFLIKKGYKVQAIDQVYKIEKIP